MEKLKHRFHEHPLTFVEELEDDGVRCKGCWQSISGPCYRCDYYSYNCQYFLHKSCMELPLEITHPMHPHRLQLFDDKHPIHGGRIFPCDYCKIVPKGFRYACPTCQAPYFFLDLSCGHTSLLKLQRGIQHRTHNPSIYISKPAIFSCDACGVEHKGNFYLCTTCEIMVNERCFASPESLKHDNHKHNLTLAKYLRFEDFKFLHTCEICHKRLGREYWTYYCEKCRYFVHLKCAKSNIKLSSEIQDEANLITLPPSDESIDPMALFVKKISGQGNYDGAAYIKHPSHMHPLILSDVQSKAPVGQCNGCALPVLAPFYHCAKIECRFLLHVGCAELPKQLQLPSHNEHTLELNTELPITENCCKICHFRGNIFMYKCSICRYQIDCKCASLTTRSTIRHEAHEHALDLQLLSRSKCCSFCDSYSFQVFACDSCSFNVCFDCALLRRVMWHRYDKHPFKLYYSPSLFDAIEFYCEICEEEIDPKLYFYHCGVCDQSIHPKCIPWCKKSNFKFGITFKVDIHPHILTLVEEPKSGSSCESCRRPWGFAVYECETCGFWIHIDCLDLSKVTVGHAL